MASNNDMKRKFDGELLKQSNTKGSNSKIFTLDKYKALIEEVKAAKPTNKKTSTEYRRLARFDVIQVGELEKLIEPVKKDQNIWYFLYTDETFDIIHEIHLRVGHGGRNRMFCIRETSDVYVAPTDERSSVFGVIQLVNAG
ncbi:uncharacterized protein TRIADDRAFT_56052 [Trichoplax adhaerens]|uniref:Integrase zinc-binding domain-containing protein n=1 Tax=Trichoplax adhaerens TaxID=10228 RepID=B3RTU6_TRIAD|nr:hypothetical protein TRIADDRAFT_56052 [Trichoplax adhaerens]EDV25687.1 hypothetical protein TRIADDRAFT_56052 [Trichoplax adhaerens]|eukprot:XP_002111720.1 hypothetical protein TRIADDRAFT_56052 [Trichoplax adhaerens]